MVSEELLQVASSPCPAGQGGKSEQRRAARQLTAGGNWQVQLQRKVSQKITVSSSLKQLGEIRVKTCGKSTRWSWVTNCRDKPRALKCHVNRLSVFTAKGCPPEPEGRQIQLWSDSRLRYMMRAPQGEQNSAYRPVVFFGSYCQIIDYQIFWEQIVRFSENSISDFFPIAIGILSSDFWNSTFRILDLWLF